MKHLKKSLAMILVFAMTFIAVAPLSEVFADSLEVQQEEPKLEISELKEGLTQAVKSVEDIEPADEKYKEVMDQFYEAHDFLDKEIKVAEMKQRQAVGSGEAVGALENTIYDLSTIPVRVQLMIRIGRAIRFATTELSNKVVAAHTKITEYIITGLLYAVNPFASEAQIMDYIQKFDQLEQELLAYPDLGPNDIATIYKKAAVWREIREAKKVRASRTRFGNSFIVRELSEEISKTVGLQFRITVKCGELDEQVKKLHEAMEKITGPKIKAEKIEFKEGNMGAISINKTTTISPVVRPNEVKDKEVFIYSSNAFMARVVGKTIIPLRTGTVMITVVSKDGCAKSNFELHIVEPGHSVEGIPFLQATGENSEYLNTNTNGGGVVGDNSSVGKDIYEVKNIGFSVKSTTLKIGDTFDLKSKTFVFPENALEKEVSYKSDNEAIATVNEKGTIEAIAEGSTTITATTKNGVTNKFKLNVIKKVDKDEYQITEINPSERKAGIFSIEFKATKNAKKYNGPAKVTVSNTKKAIEREVYFNNGVASVKYNGFEFGTWVKDFNVKIELKDQVKTFELNY